MRVCSTPSCPTIYDGRESKCPTHRKQADTARGTASERGYNTRGHRAFRVAVLTRDYICVMPGCLAFATVADHYPRSKRELIDAGLNSNDPQYGRGLCHRCHSIETAQHQPGGWHA
jgi:5-methylcytosine-specific restriction protein A